MLFNNFREVSTNHSSASTVVSGCSSATQHQNHHMPASSPLSQFTPNGEVQKLKTTTPPHNLSNPQTQQRGKCCIIQHMKTKLDYKSNH